MLITVDQNQPNHQIVFQIRLLSTKGENSGEGKNESKR